MEQLLVSHFPLFNTFQQFVKACAGIVQYVYILDYGLDFPGFEFRQRRGFFFPHQNVQTYCGAR